MNVFENFNGNSPVNSRSLRGFLEVGNVTLPKEYIRFLQRFDGGEGFVGPNSYVIFWRLGELLKSNKAYQVATHAPGLFLFGSDGGGEAFAFDTRSESKSVVSVPFVGMDMESIRNVAPNFDRFLELLYES